ncbi:ankyrin repeat-containing domain protein [Corynascus novoguineensis]|uniref:Ankyrin repeat-containing domain protein n=1 Tax=Corynascus novoguineensis TaxID=1126955 RepID=A0AAN7CJA8_9PEZI|nr:ankyrin repeat-containing domain protein [Corynascus novoguineensis]
MADPFGILAVIGVIGQIAQVAVNLRQDWKDAPVDIKRFLAELQTLKTALSEALVNILTNEEFKNAFDGRHSTLPAQFGDTTKPTNTSPMVLVCKQKLDNLLNDLTKQAQGHQMDWERLKRAFLATKTRGAIENLQRQCETLNCFMAVDALSLGARIRKEANQKNKAILDWVTTVDYSSQQRDFIGYRQAGTGQWLLDSTEYQQWIETAKQTLFCPGIPGAGKTILTSIVVDDLYTRFRNDVHVGIAYIYCNFRRQADQKVEDLLSNLIRQLSQDQSPIPECLRALYDKHKSKTRPSFDELARVLQTVANLFSRIFIVVDALDECRLSDGSRSKFLTEIFALQNKTGANIFATSRFIRDVTKRFENTLSLEIRAQPEDVQRYINGNMDHLPTCITQRPDLCQELITKIVKAADGVFLLAQLHLDSFKGETSVKDVRAALKTLYTGSQAYEHAYNHAMDRIEGQLKGRKKLAKKVLSWITCAKRPLSTSELQHALGVEVGKTKLDPDNIPPLEDTISVCAGLVIVDEESDIIRLVHHTTQEFLERTWKQWFPDTQAEITDICVTYLSFSSFESGLCHTKAEFEDRLRLNRLYAYAACYWGEHAREAGRTSQVALDFLTNDCLVGAQVQGMMIKEPMFFQSYSQSLPKQMQGLHVAAYFGISDVLETLLHSSNNNDVKDSFRRTPLWWAARNGHGAVVKVLLGTGKVDADSKDKDGQTPLSCAAWNGHKAVVKMLLDRGKVDVNSKDTYGRTPLSWAAWRGHKIVAKMLLDIGKVDADSKHYNFRTPLSCAAKNGHKTVVKILLDTGKTPLWCAAKNGHKMVVKMLLDTGKVDVNPKDKDGRTPLSWVAKNGHEAVVKMLLDTGKATIIRHEAVVQMLLDRGKVDVNPKDNDGWTPLLWAAMNGHEVVVQMLLDTGKVDVNSKDKDGQTPLSLAARNGYEVVVKMLLDTGKVDVNLKDKIGRTPLSWAAWRRHEAVVKMLLDTGKVDADSKDNDGRTPLSYAAWEGHEAVVKMLLDTGRVDVDLKDNDGKTPLSWAAWGGYEEVVQMLLGTGKVDVDSKDNNGRTPLSWAAENKREEVVNMLLDIGKVDADSKDNDGRTPLWWAAFSGSKAVVQMLLDTGKVDIDLKDNNGRTPLSCAAKNRCEEVVKMLLDIGKVDADSKDNDGRTPLWWAASKGHTTVVKMLLDTGKVDADSKDDDGRTPLWWAAWYRHKVVVKLLLDTRKVDVDLKDNDDGQTPLSYAAQDRKEAVVKMLFDTGNGDTDSRDKDG